jgi:MOSC domain-containing protein YiiM
VNPVVVAVYASTKAKAPLRPLERATAIENKGIDGDRHSLPGNRRAVLLMEQEVLDLFGLSPGDVREQVTVRGLELTKLVDGSRLQIGEALFEVAGPCDPCERMDEVKPGLQQELEGRRGRFVKVIRGGVFGVGDAILVNPEA